MVERRILGKETVHLIDGTSKEVDIYAVKLSEKNYLQRKYRKKVAVGTGKDKQIAVEVQDDEIIKGILEIALGKQVDYDDLDYFEDDIYDKYFTKQEVSNEKKSKLPESSEDREGK